jgi:hypothetical protein
MMAMSGMKAHLIFETREGGTIEYQAPYLTQFDQDIDHTDGLTTFRLEGRFRTVVGSDLKDAMRRRQVGGNHYSSKRIQPWDIIDEHGLNFYEGNVIKYLIRKKGSRLTDLEKAAHYLEKAIELEKSRQA